MSGRRAGSAPPGAPASLIGTIVCAAAAARLRAVGVDADDDAAGGDLDRVAALRDDAATPRTSRAAHGAAPPADEAVVGRGDDAQRRDAGALAALARNRRTGRVNAPPGSCAASVICRPWKRAPQPVDGIGRDEQRLQRVVRDRLVLQRVAAGAQRERAERRQGAAEADSRERARRAAQPARAAACELRSRSAAVAVGDRHAPVAPERALGDLDARRGLAALVLGQVDEPARRVAPPLGQPLGDQLLAAEVQLDVAVQDAVEQLIRRQRVLVALVWAQLGRGRALDDRRGDRRGRAPPRGRLGGSCATRTGDRRASLARP